MGNPGILMNIPRFPEKRFTGENGIQVSDDQLPDSGFFCQAGCQFRGKMGLPFRPRGSREKPVRQEQAAAPIVFDERGQRVRVTGIAEILSAAEDPETDGRYGMPRGGYRDPDIRKGQAVTWLNHFQIKAGGRRNRAEEGRVRILRGSMDASNMLKPYMEQGSIRFIGSTTYDEYNRYFSKSRGIVRRFQQITGGGAATPGERAVHSEQVKLHGHSSFISPPLSSTTARMI